MIPITLSLILQFGAPDDTPAQPKIARTNPPYWKDVPGRVWVRNTGCQGTVTAVDRFEITVQRPGEEKPHTFLICKELSEAKIPPGCGIGPTDNLYLPGDVRVGDKVSIDYSEDKQGGVLCYQISIMRRPGGRVPPGYGVFTLPPIIRHHEEANAYQDWEEKGIPIPDKFLSPWQLEARRAKIAPPPREARPRIPPAKQ